MTKSSKEEPIRSMQAFDERFFPKSICACGCRDKTHELLLGGGRGGCKRCKDCFMFKEKAKEEKRRKRLNKKIAKLVDILK